ncbi:MAG TPA: STAS domain-containing protein [Streptosporangiaceae bacterium]|nr:STAS domain-containing protein [Streptosporangiaceae bacterium]
MSEQPDQLSQVNGVPVVKAAIEVDASNAQHLRDAIVTALSGGATALIVDMSETEFCDSTGLNVLVRAHKRLAEARGELLLVAIEPTLLRIFKVTGMDTMFHLFASLGEALVAAAKPTQ